VSASAWSATSSEQLLEIAAIFGDGDHTTSIGAVTRSAGPTRQ
jgi:hypothetical protein